MERTLEQKVEMCRIYAEISCGYNASIKIEDGKLLCFSLSSKDKYAPMIYGMYDNTIGSIIGFMIQSATYGAMPLHDALLLAARYKEAVHIAQVISRTLGLWPEE